MKNIILLSLISIMSFSSIAEAKKRKQFSEDSSNSISCLSKDAKSLWYDIKDQFPSVYPISTCRPGAVIATSGNPSRHASGNAIDFETGGHSKSKIVTWLRNNHFGGGTMTYNDMDHIHVDIGRHFVALNRPSGH